MAEVRVVVATVGGAMVAVAETAIPHQSESLGSAGVATVAAAAAVRWARVGPWVEASLAEATVVAAKVVVMAVGMARGTRPGRTW